MSGQVGQTGTSVERETLLAQATRQIRAGLGLHVVAPPGCDPDDFVRALEAATDRRSEPTVSGARFAGDDPEVLALGPEHARARRVSEDEPALSEELLATLDGLPFATELAHKVARIVGPVEDVRELLDVAHRGTTLRGLIEERWRLASPDAQNAALRLSTWIGAIGSELARKATGLEERATTALLELVELGLLHREPTGLLRLLHPIRAVLFERARRELAADDDVYAGLHAGSTTLDLRNVSWSHIRERVEWRSSLGRHEDALAFVLAVEPILGGPVFVETLRALLERSGSGSPLRARALLHLGRALYLRGRHDEARTALERSYALLTTTSAPAEHATEHATEHALAARVAGQLSLVARACGRWEDAERGALSAIEHANLSNDAGLEAEALLRFADLVAELGRTDEAMEHRLLAVAHARRSDNREIRARVVGGLAVEHLQRGDLEAFERLIPEALREAHDLGDRYAVATLETNVGIAAALRDRFDDAERSFVDALRAFRELEHPANEAILQQNRGWMRLVAEWPDALACFESALVAATRAGNRSLQTSATVGLVVALARLGRLDEALVERMRAWAELEPSPGQLDVLALQSACLDVLHARALAEGGDEMAANELRASARRALDASSRTRVLEHPARRVLERWLAEECGRDELPTLKLSAEARWFFLREVGWVDLRRRRALRAILGRLADAATSGASDGVPSSELTSVGWPGERIVPHAAASRLYVAVRTLRQLGLGKHLETTRVGYRLDPELRILTGVPSPVSE